MTDVFRYIDPWGKTKTLRINGHYLLVRRCELPESNFLASEQPVNAPDLPNWMQGIAEASLRSMQGYLPTNFCEVLAIGPDVGKPRTKHNMKKFAHVTRYKVPWALNSNFKVGDFVVLPEHAVEKSMWRGVTGYEYDILIDWSQIKVRIPYGD